MGEFSKWLLDEDRKELFDYLFAVALCAVFLALAALLLRPLLARALFGRFFDFYGRFLDPYGWFSGLFANTV
ncbi:MAG TPA: hypothetical protein VF736_19295 [Pyrinomonadaceae bacterium]|jgi:hypothetical protein